jgi:hypothetical protein
MPDSTPPPWPPPVEAARPAGRRISTILEALPGAVEGERISFGDLLDAFDSRAFGPLIVVFAAPNILPVALPGISAVLGAPLILLAWQLMLGRQRPWLPGILRRRSLARCDFERLVARIVPRLRRIERLLRPRLLALTGPVGKRLVGAAALLLSMIVFLPVPFGNAIPGVALVLLAAGLLGRDGGAVLAGLLIGLVGVGVVWGFIWGLMEAALLLARHGLGG